jgi:hypothetical protein
MVQNGTAGAVCMNGLCGWREFPSPMNIVVKGTTASMKAEVLVNLTDLAKRLLVDLETHHHQIVHTMQIPNDCPTCALIKEAQRLRVDVYSIKG